MRLGGIRIRRVHPVWLIVVAFFSSVLTAAAVVGAARAVAPASGGAAPAAAPASGGATAAGPGQNGSVSTDLNVSKNVNITRAAGYQGTESISVDPANPRQLFMLSGDIVPGAGVNGVAVFGARSTDGGATWTDGAIGTGVGGLPAAAGDPGAAWDDDGDLFLSYMAANQAGVVVLLSTDGGATFKQLTTLDPNHDQGIDHPSIATGDGSVWVEWTALKTAHDEISVSGAAVHGLGAVGPFGPPERAGAGSFGGIAVGPAGAVMVSYTGNQGSQAAPATIRTAVDPDGLGPKGLSAPRVTESLTEPMFDAIPAQPARKVTAVPTLAWDRSNGPHRGRVYLVYTNAPASDHAATSVYVTYSDDTGAHWSKPARVNDAASARSAFLPRIAVDQTTGDVAVSWYDARDSGTDTTAQVWAATSDDGTAFSPDFQVSTGTSSAPGIDNPKTTDNDNDFGDYTGLDYDAGTFYPAWADNSDSTKDNPDGAGGNPDIYTAAIMVTKTAFTAAASAVYHESFTASARLTHTGGSPVSGATVGFSLGKGGGTESCKAKTNSSGDVKCSLTPDQAAGPTKITATFAGTASAHGSTTSAPFTVKPEPAALTYTGPKRIANGGPARLSGVLKEHGTTKAAIAGRKVTFTLGAGKTRQSCTATTGRKGSASCVISAVKQRLTASATTALATAFGGDTFYLPSRATASPLLQYYTGGAYSLSASVDLAGVSLNVGPNPVTKPVRAASATVTTTPCTANVPTAVVTAAALCARVRTALAPGTSTATATVAHASIGLPGLPVIGISGLTATSRSSCTATAGAARLTLTIGGAPVTVPTKPNSTINLPGGAKLIINQQTRIPGGLTVNAVHLIVSGGLADVIVGSSTSDAHNCS